MLANVYGQVILIWLTVDTVDRVRHSYAPKCLLEKTEIIWGGKTHGKHNLTGARSRPPEVVRVMPTDYLRKMVSGAEEIKRSRFSIIACENTGMRSLYRR